MADQRVVRAGLMAIVAIAGNFCVMIAVARPPEPRGDGALVQQMVGPANEFKWCTYPHHDRAASAARPTALTPATEMEPNDTVMQAQAIVLGTAMGQDPDVTVSGVLSNSGDIDLFKASLLKGDILGLACHVTSPTDSLVTVLDSMGTAFFGNDDHGGLNSSYPAGAPWPSGTGTLDSALTFVVPADGDYLIRVTAANAGGAGAYDLELRIRRAAIEEEYSTPLKQILFIDFNGATINANALFGSGGRTTATLSPLSNFLGGWGLTGADESAVIDAILMNIQGNFNALRQMSLNGDFPNDMMPGHFDLEIRNSRDHPDPFGQANVSRVIIGGSVSQLGISTIGIAEFIDPGNYSQSDTAVVLLDLLSASAANPNSVNSIPRAGGVTIIDAVGLVVGNVASHEAGHFFGNWHTVNSNGTNNIMDQGGDILNRAGVGMDGTLGTMDDIPGSFTTDTFEPSEGVGIGTEKCDVVTAFGLSTGKLAADMAAPTVMSKSPDTGAMVANVQSVTVTFNEPVMKLTGSELTVNGSAATTASGSGSGPFMFSGYAAPAAGMVTIVLGAGGSVKDLSNNDLTQVMWTIDVHDCNGNGVHDTTDISSGTSRDCPADGIPDECEPGSLVATPGSTQTITLGQSIALNTPTATGGTAPYVFAWNVSGPGGPLSSTDAQPTFTPSAAGDYTVQLQVTDAIACTVNSSFIAHVMAVSSGGGGDGGDGMTDAPMGMTGCGAMCGSGGAGMMAAVFVALFATRAASQRRRLIGPAPKE